MSRLEVVRIGGRKQLAYQRQRACVTAPSLSTTAGIASHDQGPASLGKITGIASLLRDLPEAGKTYPVRMNYAPKPFAVGAPAQIRVGIHRSFGGLAKQVGLTKWDDTAQNA